MNLFSIENVYLFPEVIVGVVKWIFIKEGILMAQVHALQNIGPDLDPNCFTLRRCSWRIFLKGKKSAEDK